MDRIVFGEYTVQDLVILAIVLAGVFVLFGLLKKVFSSSKKDKHTQQVRCAACGWQGTVSRYAGVCPKCGAKLGERRTDSR